MKEKLINRCFSKIVLKNRYINKLWVYGVYDKGNNLVFMNYGSLKEIVSMSPFKAVDKFNEEECYTFVLIQPCESKYAAENALVNWINNSELEGRTPPMNIYSKSYNNRWLIQCVENKRFYQSASEVAKIFSIAQSALSNHLRGVPGYKSVRGLHFKYYTGENPAEIEQFGGYKLQHTPLGGYKTVESDCPINKKGISQDEKLIEIGKLACGFGGDVW
jgi:hypothetical protein